MTAPNHEGVAWRYKKGCRCSSCTEAKTAEMARYRAAQRKDENDHEIRIRMLGNSEIFVTCKCLDKVRRGWKGNTIKNRLNGTHHVKRSADWKSLGDFPVGTPTEKLVEAYNAHLEESSGSLQPSNGKGEKCAR